MEDSKKVKIKNRGFATVIYSIPEMGNIRREFSELEEKIVTFEELRRGSYLPGVRYLFENNLVIKDPEVIKELGLEVEPEYYYGAEEVDELLKNGSIDQFLDCLDFAPDGVIDLIKERAVVLPLNDVAKREILLSKLDYDVTKIIEVRKASHEGEQETTKGNAGKRRAAPVGAQTKTQEKDAKSSARRVPISQD